MESSLLFSFSHIVHHSFPRLAHFFPLAVSVLFSPTSWLKKVSSLHFTPTHTQNLLCGCYPVTPGQDRWPGLFQTASSRLVCIEARAALQRPQRLRSARRKRGAPFLHTDSLFTQSPFKIKQFNYKNGRGSSLEHVNTCVWSYSGMMWSFSGRISQSICVCVCVGSSLEVSPPEQM